MSLFARFTTRKHSVGAPAGRPQQTEKPGFRCVKVRPGGDACCQFVRSLTDERFLLDEAPSLPLALCDAADCQCTYRRFDDRRAGPRRASDVAFDIASNQHGEENRDIRVPGRRSKDTPDF